MSASCGESAAPRRRLAIPQVDPTRRIAQARRAGATGFESSLTAFLLKID
jgi:hypothetical protein